MEILLFSLLLFSIQFTVYTFMDYFDKKKNMRDYVVFNAGLAAILTFAFSVFTAINYQE